MHRSLDAELQGAAGFHADAVDLGEGSHADALARGQAEAASELSRRLLDPEAAQPAVSGSFSALCSHAAYLYLL